jgi:formamidopyrimidine-DNA glycosylase
VPELPEVETIARQLRELVIGRRVSGFEAFWHRVTEPVPAAHFAARLAGREITGVGRRGKFVVLELDGGEALIVSLRMTGKLLFREPGTADDPFVRALVRFADGTVLRFADTRKFGRMSIVDRAELAEDDHRGTVASRPGARAAAPENRPGQAPLHRVLGIEPLSHRFTARWLSDFVQLRSRGAIKPLLLDQRGIAGVGNIYAVEALWRARIHPLRAAGSLRPDEVARLREALRFVLRKGIRLGGASQRDYVDARGGQGRMQREFQVYDRRGEPCPRCGRAIVRTVVGGRGTFHCPRCQRAPRGKIAP